MEMIDLRSDTMTQPTPAMREAMAQAKVGDDVFEEDPTIKQLEQSAAKKIGKESALFVPSGTMGNLVSVLTHCGRGDEVMLGNRSHIFLNEVGGISALGGVHPCILANEKDGTIPVDLLENAVRDSGIHHPATRLICLENTHNYCSGSPVAPEYMEQVSDLASQYKLKIHLDGARIFNAAIALNVEAAALAKHADSVMFCLSKGLSAPVGSLICGSVDFIRKTRKLRKMVGGGMRQAGHLAAAGLIALEKLTDRLAEDHQNTRQLANGLASMDGIELDLECVKTNIIFFRLTGKGIDPDTFLQKLESKGIKILPVESGIFRAVLHREVSAKQVETVLEVLPALLKN